MSNVVITPPARASFPALVVPRKIVEDGPAKYSLVLVFSPGTSTDWAMKELRRVGTEAWGEKFAELLKSSKFRHPIRLTDDDERPRYEPGSWYLSAYSTTKPGCVHRYADPETGKPKRMTDDEVEDMIYPGALVRASLRFFAYDNKGKGIGVALNNVQLLDATLPRFDNRVRAEDEFEAEEEVVEPVSVSATPERVLPGVQRPRKTKIEELL